ncbi:MAG: type II toxin-antitoxin system RelE/ParE family toxin [Candidatus Nanohaloarchaea archaeon]
MDIVITDTVREQLRKWDGDRRERFYSKVEKLESYPDSYGKPLRGRLSGLWELYFDGSFRILYSIDRDQEVVYVKEVRYKDEF